MKHTIAFAVPLLLLLTGSDVEAADRWSPDQQEVLAHVEDCWAAWADAVRAKDPSIWENRCRPADEVVWWWTPDAAPMKRKSLTRLFQSWLETTDRVVWWDVRPSEITIIGDVAIVYFYSRGSLVRDGNRLNFSSKRVEHLRRVDGQWSFLGGMVNPEIVAP